MRRGERASGSGVLQPGCARDRTLHRNLSQSNSLLTSLPVRISTIFCAASGITVPGPKMPAAPAV